MAAENQELPTKIPSEEDEPVTGSSKEENKEEEKVLEEENPNEGSTSAVAGLQVELTAAVNNSMLPVVTEAQTEVNENHLQATQELKVQAKEANEAAEAANQNPKTATEHKEAEKLEQAAQIAQSKADIAELQQKNAQVNPHLKNDPLHAQWENEKNVTITNIQKKQAAVDAAQSTTTTPKNKSPKNKTQTSSSGGAPESDGSTSSSGDAPPVAPESDSSWWGSKFTAAVQEMTAKRNQYLTLLIPVLVMTVILFYLTRTGKASAKKAAEELGEFCRPQEAPLSAHNREYLLRAQLVTAMQVPASAVFRGADGVERRNARHVCGRVQQLLGEGAHGQYRTPITLFASFVSLLPFVFMAKDAERHKAGMFALVGWCLLVGSGYFFVRKSTKKENKWRKTLGLLSTYFDKHGVGELGLPPADFELSGVTQETLDRLLEGGEWHDAGSLLPGAKSANQRKHAMRVVKMQLGISLPLTAVVDAHMEPLEGRGLAEGVIAFVIGHQEATLKTENIMKAAAQSASGSRSTQKSVSHVLTSDVDEDDGMF
jgi:chemotaxis protein histidine kinase CheA